MEKKIMYKGKEFQRSLRRLYNNIIFCIALAVAANRIDAGQKLSSKPNVVLLIVEDLSTPRLGCYGHKVIKSPNIDAFANDAVVFDRAYAQVPLCTPSRSSILTAVRPETSDLYYLDQVWREALPNAVSLPKHFRDNGYYTCGVGKTFDPRAGAIENGAWDKVQGVWGENYAQKAVQALGALTSVSKPFFLAMGFKQVHEVGFHDVPQSYKDMYPQNEIEPEAGLKDNSLQATQQFLQNYYASVSFLDHECGLILDALKEKGFYDNSIIVVWAGDHGYNLGENNHWGKWHCYEMCMQIPFLMRVPGSPANGKRVTGLVEAIDLYPTLVEMCGLSNPTQKMEGLSFAPLLKNPGSKWKKAAFSSWKSLAGAFYNSLVTERYRYYEITWASGGKEKYLYDLSNDPRGHKDVIKENQAIAAQLEKQLSEGWNNDIHGTPIIQSHKKFKELKSGIQIRLLQSNTLSLSLPLQFNPTELSLYTMQGKKVMQQYTSKNRTVLVDVSSLSKGVYIVHLESGGRQIERQIHLL